jgi:hypothetical protein
MGHSIRIGPVGRGFCGGVVGADPRSG